MRLTVGVDFRDGGRAGGFAAALAAGVLFFLVAIIQGLRNGKKAGPDPWNAWTLEWSTSSPPPEYNFAESPEVHSRRPLWDLKHPEDPDWKYE